MGAAATATAVAATDAKAAPALDLSLAVPYPPHPRIDYPNSWSVYTALIPRVIMPYDVVISNQPLAPLRDINGGPDLTAAPGDATIFMMFIYDPVPIASAYLEGLTKLVDRMRFKDLGGGERNWMGFRQFLGGYYVTEGDSVYSMGVRVYVGDNAGPEWTQVQPIVDSVRLGG